MNTWHTKIGLEIHGQVNSTLKMFSKVPNKEDIPNKNTTYWEFGYPGILPSINHDVINKVHKFAKVFNGNINSIIKFDRKHYFYPDLSSGYQITQFYEPILRNGYLEIDLNNKVKKKFFIEEMHMESDAGKNLHFKDYSLLDYNRLGTGLFELVTKPCFSSAEEVIQFVKEIIIILKHLDVCNCDMSKGNLRVDVNLSIFNDNNFSNRCEIKNLNSFESISSAIAFEYNRHVMTMNQGGEIKQATLLYDQNTNVTKIIRLKESYNEYIFIPDADIPPLFLEDTEKNTFVMPTVQRQELINKFNLSFEQSCFLINDPKIKKYFLDCIPTNYTNKIIQKIFNVINSDIMSLCNLNNIKLWNAPVIPEYIKNLVLLWDKGEITTKILKNVLEESWNNKKDPLEILKSKSIKQVIGEELKNIIQKIIRDNPIEWTRFTVNKEDKLLQFFIGQIMRSTKGQASTDETIEYIRQLKNI